MKSFLQNESVTSTEKTATSSFTEALKGSSTPQSAAEELLKALPVEPNSTETHKISHFKNGKRTVLLNRTDESFVLGILKGMKEGTLRMGDARIAGPLKAIGERLEEAVEQPAENTAEQIQWNKDALDRFCNALTEATAQGLLTENHQLARPHARIGF